MGDSGVYNSTTISYENPGGGLSMSSGGQRRPWNLSEMVSPPTTRSRWFHWTLLMGGSIVVGLGLIVIIIGIYNQHYYNPESKIVKIGEDESPPSHWIVTLLGFTLTILGLILLLLYCKMVSTNRFLCNPLTRGRSALRQVVTKPRYQNGQTSQGANLLVNDRGNVNPMSTQYDPVPDIGYRHPNGDISSEEKAKLMAHEVKEGIDDIPSSSCDALLINGSDSSGTTPSTNSSSKDPRIVLHPFAKASATNSAAATQPPRKVFARRSPSPPQRPARQFSSLRRTNPATSQNFHYKPRHFTGHGYGQARLPSSAFAMPGAPLASAEDITPSLRSSFASVMMYAPSDWGNSDESIDSSVFLNLPPLSNRNADDEDDNINDDDDEFRVSPGRSGGRKYSLSSLSIQSAFP